MDPDIQLKNNHLAIFKKKDTLLEKVSRIKKVYEAKIEVLVFIKLSKSPLFRTEWGLSL